MDQKWVEMDAFYWIATSVWGSEDEKPCFLRLKLVDKPTVDNWSRNGTKAREGI